MKSIFLILFVFFLIPSFAGADELPPLPTIETISKKLDEIYRADGATHATLTMTISKKRRKRTLKMESWSKGEKTALILIRKPAREAGTATLMTPDGLWNYAPRADRLIRIPKGLLGESWMGSDFTNDDLVQNTKYNKDFEANVSWTQLGEKTLLKIVFTPKKDVPVVFTRLEFLMDPTTWMPLTAKYFDGKKLTRTLTFSDVRKIGKRYVPFRMELKSNTKNSTTIIQYHSIVYDVKIENSIFTKRGLRRVAKSR